MNSRPDQTPSVLRPVFPGLAAFIGFSICLLGLILTAYGALLVMSPPFGPAILVFGLVVLASGIVLLRLLMRRP
jgi:hypothetical protein